MKSIKYIEIEHVTFLGEKCKYKGVLLQEDNFSVTILENSDLSNKYSVKYKKDNPNLLNIKYYG